MIADNLCKLALRKIGALASGTEMSASEGAEALELLRSLYRTFVGQASFGEQRSVYVPANEDITAWPNTRIVTEDYATSVITLPLLIDDTTPKWDYGWGPYRWAAYRPGPPEDFSIITVNDRTDPSIRFTYVYDAAFAQWTDIESFVLADEAPLSTRMGNELAAMLAIELAPEYGADALTASQSPNVQLAARNGRVAITHKYATRRRANVGVYI